MTKKKTKQDFAWARGQLEKGQAVRRRSWHPAHHVVFNNGRWEMRSNTEVMAYGANFADVAATDWVTDKAKAPLFQKPKPAPHTDSVKFNAIKEIWEAMFPCHEFAPRTFGSTLSAMLTAQSHLRYLEQVWINNRGRVGNEPLSAGSLQQWIDKYKTFLANNAGNEKPATRLLRLLPAEITDCRDCPSFRVSPSHNLACAPARLYNNATERQVYVVPKRNADGVYQPLDDCPLKKKAQ